MRRLLGATTIALLISAPASAATTGATLKTDPPAGQRHTFTLQAARRLDTAYERNQGFQITRPTCGWVRVHIAGCVSHLTAVVIDGQPAEHYTLIDYVTRSGPCENAGPVVKRRGGITWQKGGDHPRFGNCFNGPLVVEPHSIY